MKNVFIDSNIWLSLYYFTNDDLEQFKKLMTLLDKDIKLMIPAQTKSEVTRNRDAKIKDTLSKFEKFDLNFPAFAKKYEEYSEFHDQYTQLRGKHNDWIKKIKNDIENETLPADNAIRDFFEKVDELECDKDIILLAEQRYKRGNPPGKDNKYGDAINWECLLSNVPNGEDIFIISADGDYTSILDKKKFNYFLEKEWKEKKNAKVIYYTSLSEFLKNHYEDIKLKTEQEKDELISALAQSRNFTTTHAIIRQLARYSDWTTTQKVDLLDILDNNSQVLWIVDDEDVHDFYTQLIDGMDTENESVIRAKQLLFGKESSKDIDDSDLPF